MIYGKFSEYETQNEIAMEGFEFEGTLEEMQNILMESAQDMYEIQTGMLIADVVIEESVLESAVGMEEIESVMEGVVKDSLTKLKELFFDEFFSCREEYFNVINCFLKPSYNAIFHLNE